MNKEFQMDLFHKLNVIRKYGKIKYDYHFELIELGFRCSRVGKTYEKRISYKNYFIDFLFKRLYPNCYFAHISYFKEMQGYSFNHLSFITDDDIGKRIFYNYEIQTYPTYLLSFDDLLSQFIMRYKNVASNDDISSIDELYRIRDEDCLKRAQ